MGATARAGSRSTICGLRLAATLRTSGAPCGTKAGATTIVQASILLMTLRQNLVDDFLISYPIRVVDGGAVV
jgi:hypothetical protein